MTDLSPVLAEGVNAKAYSVSELAFALKRTIEDAYGFVRLRGELSKVTFHGNGHVYLDLKDDKACISGVIWKTSVRGLSIRPQTGLEVVVTGKVTTYPGRSQYQIIIETMEPAGVGALLAQLERLKARLAAEGLFDAARKRPLPTLPAVIGVVTSPTGAVIRDILHRIADRWPCRVVVWSVVVQGEQAAAQVRAAVEGFANLAAGGPAPRPDLIIVARGGGSVEDLWPFNDEALARAVAACPIPVVSAVGHETDTTLIDFVSDRRAPTPTAAAELATPVFADLAATLADYERRMLRCASRMMDLGRARLAAAAGRLPRVPDLLAIATQRLDMASGRVGAALTANVAAHRHDLATKGATLRPRLLAGAVEVKSESLTTLGRRLDAALSANIAAHRHGLAAKTASLRPRLLSGAIEVKSDTVQALARRLEPLIRRTVTVSAERLANLEKLRLSLDPDRPLSRGFARVEREDGHLLRSAAAAKSGEAVRLVFHDGNRAAVIDGAAKPPAASVPPTTPRKGQSPPPVEQGRLF